jgi:oligopeptide transport system ATP-binding protein
MSTILHVRDLVTRFYTFDGVVHALNGVGFDLDAGETLAIVGESGSGKSVTMLSLLHLLPTPPARIEGGQAIFQDNGSRTDLLKLSKTQISRIRGAKIGFIFQDALSALNPVMTVGDQISESLIEHLKMGHDQARKRTIELLDRVGIPGASQRFKNYPHQFSGGMRQRVMIAVAIACNPKIVIADEPTTALDVTVQAQIVELTQRLQKELNIAVIWITHDLGVVAGIEGTPPDLLEKPHHCQFAWRCPFAFDRCWQAIPQSIEIEPGHFITCFYDVAKEEPRHDL